MKIDERDGAVMFLIRVIPRASRNSIEGEYQDALKMRLTAPPLDGRANEAVRRMLAEALKLPLSAVRIVAGEKNRTKRVAIEGVSRAAYRKPGCSVFIVRPTRLQSKIVPDIKAIQAELKANKIDGWLFCDHHRRDLIAAHVLGLGENGMATRRWFYFIPVKGEPRKLVHRIESSVLDALDGRTSEYSGWEELHKALPKLLSGSKTVAMQYSPENNIPYIGLVDAGTIELVRKLKKKVVSSADLVQQFEARWSAEQLASHLEAGRIVDRIREGAFEEAASTVRQGKPLAEYQLQQWILERFRSNGLTTAEPPIAAVQPNNGSPHYEPRQHGSQLIRAGDLLLLDMWAKMDRPGSVYYDITWVGYLGKRVPDSYAKIFRIVRDARDRAIEFVKESVEADRPIRGWQVDLVARNAIRKAGYAKYFVHRTGHSIGQEVHGNGANMDGLETRDDRKIISRTCFSIEPGIYLPEFGIRSEVNVYVDEDAARVTGAIQDEILSLLA